jgi:hypothetical protein
LYVQGLTVRLRQRWLDQRRAEGTMIILYHTHLMASDIDVTIGFWRDHFGAEVVFDGDFDGRHFPDRYSPAPRSVACHGAGAG